MLLMTLTNFADIATILAGIGAIWALWYTAREIKKNNKISRGQFW